MCGDAYFRVSPTCVCAGRAHRTLRNTGLHGRDLRGCITPRASFPLTPTQIDGIAYGLCAALCVLALRHLLARGQHLFAATTAALFALATIYTFAVFLIAVFAPHIIASSVWSSGLVEACPGYDAEARFREVVFADWMNLFLDAVNAAQL